jgi:hypothetical protein
LDLFEPSLEGDLLELRLFMFRRAITSLRAACNSNIYACSNKMMASFSAWLNWLRLDEVCALRWIVAYRLKGCGVVTIFEFLRATLLRGKVALKSTLKWLLNAKFLVVSI